MPGMTPETLLDRLVALHAKHGEAHRRMVAALHANDLLALVSACREQGALCTEQGAVLADYVAARLAEMQDVDPVDRARVTDLANQLRDESQLRRHEGAG
jgi:hypothetical protein